MPMIKPKEMSERLGVTVKTLQNWDNKGILKAHRTPTNRRYYTEEQYSDFIGKKQSENHKKTVIYARVSTYGQKDDLTNQVDFIRQYANAKGMIVDETITDIGSGLNYNRKKWNRLLNQVAQHKIDTILITYKDRFIRFGFEWFKRFCESNGTKIIVLNNPNTSPDKELIEDLISIIHVFSCRLYGLRKYKKKLKNDKSLKGGDADDQNCKSPFISQFNDEKASE